MVWLTRVRASPPVGSSLRPSNRGSRFNSHGSPVLRGTASSRARGAMPVVTMPLLGLYLFIEAVSCCFRSCICWLRRSSRWAAGPSGSSPAWRPPRWRWRVGTGRGPQTDLQNGTCDPRPPRHEDVRLRSLPGLSPAIAADCRGTGGSHREPRAGSDECREALDGGLRDHP
jgi:hypothetical protein